MLEPTCCYAARTAASTASFLRLGREIQEASIGLPPMALCAGQLVCVGCRVCRCRACGDAPVL